MCSLLRLTGLTSESLHLLPWEWEEDKDVSWVVGRISLSVCRWELTGEEEYEGEILAPTQAPLCPRKEPEWYMGP